MLVVAVVYVQHPDIELNADLFLRVHEHIAQPEGSLVLIIPFPIREYHKPWVRQRNSGGHVVVVILLLTVSSQQIHKILEHPERHVWIERRLMLEQRQVPINDEGDIIPHPHEQDIVQSVDLDCGRICVVGPVDCVVELKGPFLTLLFAEEEDEEPVLVLSISDDYVVRHIVLHMD